VTAFIIRRLASLLLVLWGAVTLLFFLFFLLPNDPAELIAGGANKNPDPQVVQNVREKYGFDEPIIVQYGKFPPLGVRGYNVRSRGVGISGLSVTTTAADINTRACTSSAIAPSAMGSGGGLCVRVQKMVAFSRLIPAGPLRLESTAQMIMAR